MKVLCRCFRTLGNENRLKMLKLLTEKDICVCELKEMFSLSQSQISRDLKALYDTGFLKRWNEGKCVVYMVDRVESPPNCKAILNLVENTFNDDESIIELRKKLYKVIENKVREKSR
ncbi:ArsR/SmtB family transcription factor [Chloroflexota bacterium]